MAFLFDMFLGDGTLFEGKIIRSHTLQMQLLPNQVLSMAGRRVGKEKIREVQIR